MFPELDAIEYDTAPFEHFTGHGKQPGTCCREWLDWLETEAPWKLTTTDFYEQYEFSLLHAAPAPVVRRLACPETLTALRRRMSRDFRQPLSERVDVTAHKLVAEQTIRIHNDFIPGGESHRLLLQLNRGWEPPHGGYLMFFSGPEPETVSKVVEPRHGSVQAFAISPSPFTPSVRCTGENDSPSCIRSIGWPERHGRVHRPSVRLAPAGHRPA